METDRTAGDKRNEQRGKERWRVEASTSRRREWQLRASEWGREGAMASQ
jgi:hypothetical protein